MIKKKVLASLGGGSREEKLLRNLAQSGYTIKTLDEPPFPIPRVKVTSSVASLLQGVQLLLAPASGVDGEGKIKEPFGSEIHLDPSFLKQVEKGSTLFIGTGSDDLKERANSYGVDVFEYLHHDTIARLNSVPTAEGALLLALQELPTTLHGTKSLVCGLGRVGLAVAQRLNALQARVTGANRSRERLFQGERLGLQVISLEEMDSYLYEYRLIINTIPFPIFLYQRLVRLRKDVLLIDLASSPGGVDFGAARDLNLRADLYPGLPGRFFPECAATILAQILPELIGDVLSKKPGGDFDGIKR